ncbi:MAG: L-aspartate oxidase [Bacillota bacterium]
MVPRYLINFDLAELEEVRTDFLVIGSGAAGLFSALNLADAGEVLLLTKEQLKDCNTEYAQGGIAAVISEDDTPKSHYRDTVAAGAGLCNPQAVEILVNEGRQRINDLLNLGVNFDREGTEVDLTQEGAHSCRRILHANGDATGAEIRSSLIEQVLATDQIKVEPNTFVIDLLTKEERCYGVIAYDKVNDRYLAYYAQAVILATGGAGELYEVTSNPAVATGDGIAMAYRAGAEMMDLEFIQFHPTVLNADAAADFLISEAVRGEGGKLLNQAGDRFMTEYHQLAELAPRDVVARAIYDQIESSQLDHVYLDVTELEPDFIKQRFPTIYKTCLQAGIEMSEDYIPVRPGAHYLMGGIKTNIVGETNISGLYACGETASLGVHGANRLASNSLLDGLVYAYRTAQQVRARMQESNLNYDQLEIKYQQQSRGAAKDVTEIKSQLQSLLIDQVGIIRSQDKLEMAKDKLEEWAQYLEYDFSSPAVYEVQNLITVALLVVRAALIREESRGAHYRSDYPQCKSKWQKHILLSRNDSWEELAVDFKSNSSTADN